VLYNQGILRVGGWVDRLISVYFSHVKELRLDVSFIALSR
jgi:hypothetical protein